MKRVAFVLPSYAGGGAERVMLTFANRLDRKKYSPMLIVLDPSGPLRGLAAPDLDIKALGVARLRFALPPLLMALRTARPDVVISTLGYLNLGILLLRSFLPRHMRFVVREANSPSSSLARLPYQRFFAYAFRRLYPRANRILCPSERIARELQTIFDLPPERMNVLYNPVDEEAIRAHAAPPQRAPGEGLRFVAAGRLSEQKGFDRLLDMFAGLPGSSHLTILGDGPDRQDLLNQAEALGIANRVDFPGFMESPWGHYAGADAFLLPSRWEGMPNAALEALACGTKVIATPEAGGIGEVAGFAPPGAIILAPAGEAFAAAMRNAACAAPATPRPGLLPDNFKLDTAIGRFEAVVDEL